MRSVLPYLLLLAVLLPANLPGQLLNENFGTTFSSTYLGAPQWSSCLSRTSNSSSGACAGFPDYAFYVYNNESVTANSIFIPGTGYCLSFNYSFNAASGFPRVQIGTGGAFCFSSMTWTDLATLSQTATCDAVSYSLDPWAGQTIWIRFQAGSSFTSWYLDDILVDLGSCGGGGGNSCSTTDFSDDFADGSIGAPEWTSASGVFSSSGTPCNGGNYRAWFSTVSSPAQVISRDIDLSTATYAEFNMDYYMTAAAFSFQCAYIEVSTNGGSTWTNTNAVYPDPDGTCQQVSVDLSAFTGFTIRLRIRRSSTSQTFYFDNPEVCSNSAGAAAYIRWADNFNDNDLLLDYAGNQYNESCPSCGPWVLGPGAGLTLVPSGGWNGNTNETEAFPANMANVYYVRLDRNEWIESPVMDLSGLESFKISFYAKSSSPGTGGGDQWSFSDRLRLQIWDGAAWQTVQSMRDDLSSSWSGPEDFISAALPFNYYCFSAYKSTGSPGNYYYASAPHVNAAWFHSGFKFRVIFEGGFSGVPFAWVDDFTFRADADGYSTMIPCGLSFWNEPNATAYGRDAGTSGNTNAEKGVELELDGSINIPPVWTAEADDGDQVSQAFGVNEAERVVFCVLSEQEIRFAFPVVHFYSPTMGWQSSVMSIDNNYSGPGWKYYAVEYISCDLAGGSISPPTDQFRYYFSFEYGIEFMPVFYQLNTSGIEYGGGVTAFAETFDAPDVLSSNSCGTLPVEGLQLHAEWAGESAWLRWTTEREVNNRGFRLLRSGDGLGWEEIAWVAAQENAGSGAEYEWLDAGIAGKGGQWWYRLRQVDNDGHEVWSAVAELRRDGMEQAWSVRVLPNPSAAAARLELRGVSGQWNWEIVNAQGKVLTGGREHAVPGQGAWNLPNLASGLYFVRIQHNGTARSVVWLRQD